MQTNAAHQGLDNKQSVWIVRALAVAAVIGLLAFATPLIWAAVSAGTGLAALVAMAAVGAAAFHAMPLAMQKLENRLLLARKAEVRRNPIEQLQNEMLRRAERLKSFRKALVTVGGKIESIAQMIAEHRHRDPAFELDRQQRALHRLQQFHAVNLQRLGRAQEALEEFKLTIERKEGEWNSARNSEAIHSFASRIGHSLGCWQFIGRNGGAAPSSHWCADCRRTDDHQT